MAHRGDVLIFFTRHLSDAKFFTAQTLVNPSAVLEPVEICADSDVTQLQIRIADTPYSSTNSVADFGKRRSGDFQGKSVMPKFPVGIVPLEFGVDLSTYFPCLTRRPQRRFEG